MDLSPVNKFLKEILLPNIQNEKRKNEVSNWINEITEFDDEVTRDANRFAISIAIDLKFSHLNPIDLLQIIDGINFESLDKPHIKFENCLLKNLNRLYKCSSCSDRTFPKHRYVTVVNWGKLCGRHRPLPILSDEYESAYKAYTTKKSMKDFDDWNNYQKKITWILPLDDLFRYIKLFETKAEITEFVLDILGMENDYFEPNPRELPHFVYIVYPEHFDIESYQPTSLSGSWRTPDGLYISYPNADGYGRTYSTTGQEHTAKERVFTGSKYSNDKFQVNELGQPRSILQKNTGNILEKASKRLNGELI